MLAMAALCRHQVPAVCLNHLDNITDLHRWSILSSIADNVLRVSEVAEGDLRKGAKHPNQIHAVI